jgi:hypothetical protein
MHNTNAIRHICVYDMSLCRLYVWTQTYICKVQTLLGINNVGEPDFTKLKFVELEDLRDFHVTSIIFPSANIRMHRYVYS